VNTPGVGSHSTPDQEDGKSAECPPDSQLPENSQENLDARLDHAIEETFPTSDPISVTITKGPEPDRSDQGARFSSADDLEARPEQDSTEQILDQVREALHDVTDQASGIIRDVYNRGEHSVRQAREQYPEAERYIHASQRAVTQRVTENPLLALFMAGVAGYALAWLIHGGKRDRKPDVPDHGRTRHGYAPHREQQPA
jgi:ElaB/YqjD/DUF883 family membrane-anchored ribosome-binding protein